ncbi:MAG: hypothetical protein HY675_00765 [Chloroflexi bacterium]|nr:hypothetical protein [Chloroflexota bacterium]
MRKNRWDLALLILIGLVYLALALKVLGYDITGDEPRYLLMTHSLVNDHDFDVNNNLLNQDYRAFYQGKLGYDLTRVFGNVGARFTLHYVGLPAVLAPGYALAGRMGATLTLVVLAVLTVAGMLILARRCAPQGPGAAIATILLALTLPMMLYSSQIFPETVAATIITWAVVVVGQAAAEPNKVKTAVVSSLVIGSALASLPWLHGKFFALMGLLYLIAMAHWFRTPTGRRQMLALALPLVLSSVAMLLLYQEWYGNPWPSGPRSVPPIVSPYTIDGLLGMLIDREGGLLLRSPIYALALTALAAALVRRTRLSAEVAILFMAALWLGSMNDVWWAGLAIPPRYLVPVLPLLVAPLAYGIHRGRSTLPRVALLVLAVLSLGIAISAARFPGLDFARAGGTRESAMFRHYQEMSVWQNLLGSLDLNNVTPSFVTAPLFFVLAHNTPSEIGSTVDDPSAQDGQSRVARPWRDRSGYLLWRDPIWLLKGETLLTIRLRAEPGTADGKVARIEVWRQASDATTLLSSLELQASEVAGRGFVEVPFRFDSPNGHDLQELRVYWYGQHEVALDYVAGMPK